MFSDMQYCTFKEKQWQLFLYPVRTKKRYQERKHAQNTTRKETRCLPDQDIAPLPSPQDLHTGAAGHKSSFLNHSTSQACNHSSFSGISPYRLQLPLLINTDDIIKTTVQAETGMCQNDWPFTSGGWCSDAQPSSLIYSPTPPTPKFCFLLKRTSTSDRLFKQDIGAGLQQKWHGEVGEQ